jgi:hypothetical protein
MWEPLDVLQPYGPPRPVVARIALPSSSPPFPPTGGQFEAVQCPYLVLLSDHSYKQHMTLTTLRLHSSVMPCGVSQIVHHIIFQLTIYLEMRYFI